MERELIRNVCVIAAFVFLIFCIIVVVPNIVVSKSKVDIVSVNLNNEIEGEFVLGCGDFEEKQYYVVYKILDDGGKELMKIPADKTVIYDTLEFKDKPYVKYDVNIKGDGISYKMYLPKGTLKEKYDLSIN